MPGVVDRVTVVVDGHCRIELDEETVTVAIDPEPDRTEDERGVERCGELECRVDRTIGRLGQIVEQPPQMLGDRSDLLLLALHGETRRGVADLEEERPVTRLADRADREGIDLVEVVVEAHDGRSSASEPPVELTVSTTGVPAP